MKWEAVVEERIKDLLTELLDGGSICAYDAQNHLLAEAPIAVEGGQLAPGADTNCRMDGVPTSYTLLTADGVPVGSGSVGPAGSGADCEMRSPRILRGGKWEFESVRWA